MSADGSAGNVPSRVPRQLVPFQKGPDPRRSLTGGRPRKLIELEKLLDEHRTPEMLRPALTRLRELAMGEMVTVRGEDGEESHCEIRANPGFMKLYLERVMGPVQDDNDEKIEKLARELLTQMVDAARAKREASGG